MWLKVDWEAGRFEAAIDASTLWLLFRLLMLAGVLSVSSSVVH